MHDICVKEAQNRITPYIHKTPLISSRLLNERLGHEFIFKAECLQKTGSFKVRGAINALASLKEQGKIPQNIVTFSSGNHAQALAYACSLFGANVTVYMTKGASETKKAATRAYGAHIVETDRRSEAEARTQEAVQAGAYFIHPFDNDMIISGQGTACLEALQEESNIEAVFAPCGGGGLLSGTISARNELRLAIPVFAGEPKNANDAAMSFRQGKICKPFTDSPQTIADGAMSLCVSPRTFSYLKTLHDIYEIEEEEIFYWTQWLTHLLKITVEPTAALAMAAAYEWSQNQRAKKRILIILSGGNISPVTFSKIWERDRLVTAPHRIRRALSHLKSSPA